MTNLIIVIIAIVAIIVILLWIPNCISSRMVGICWLSDPFQARPQETNPLCPPNRKYPWQAACHGSPTRRHWNYSFPVAKALWRLRRFRWPSEAPRGRVPDVVCQLMGTGMVPWYLIRAQHTQVSHLLVQKCGLLRLLLELFRLLFCFWIVPIICVWTLKCFLWFLFQFFVELNYCNYCDYCAHSDYCDYSKSSRLLHVVDLNNRNNCNTGNNRNNRNISIQPIGTYYWVCIDSILK